VVDQNEMHDRDRNIPVFDGHNDVLSRLRDAGGSIQPFINGSEFHIDRLKAQQGGFAGGFFAMWVASPGEVSYQSLMVQDEYDIPLPQPVSQCDALQVVLQQAAILFRLEEAGALRICKSVSDLSTSIGAGEMAAILHLEGCEALDDDLSSLDVLYQAGLRSLGPVWSRNNGFGDGVPFKFPSSPDIGNGLTKRGINLVKRCNELGILIDLSHLNAKGFDDVATHSNAPLIATHSNVHSLCPHARNLTDSQLSAINQSSGIATSFLREDGRMLPDVPIEQMLRHLDYLLEHLGESGVGLGSDFDGATVPADIKDCSGLQVLVEAMRKHGYSMLPITNALNGALESAPCSFHLVASRAELNMIINDTECLHQCIHIDGADKAPSPFFQSLTQSDRLWCLGVLTEPL